MGDVFKSTNFFEGLKTKLSGKEASSDIKTTSVEYKQDEKNAKTESIDVIDTSGKIYPEHDGTYKQQTPEEFANKVDNLVNQPYTKNDLTYQEENKILESIQDSIDSSVESQLYADFNAECRYKFGCDLNKLDEQEETTAIKSFKERYNQNKEYWEGYYKWYYYSKATGETRDYNANTIDAIADFYLVPYVNYEAYTFDEIFDSFDYSEMYEVMSEDEKAYWNYTFRVKYTEYMCSDEFKDYDETNKKLHAIEFARRDADEIFKTQEYEVKAAQISFFQKMQNKYDLKEVELKEEDELSLGDYLNLLYKGEDCNVIMQNGKIYKYDSGKDNEVMIQGPNGNYYTYEVDDVDEFFNWFGQALSDEPFFILKGFTNAFSTDGSLNKAFYEEQLFKNVINATDGGSAGYHLGGKVVDATTSVLINSASPTATKIFWGLTTYGNVRRRKLREGASDTDVFMTGIFEGGNVGYLAEIVGEALTNSMCVEGGTVAEHATSFFMGMLALEGSDAISSYIDAAKEFDPEAIVTSESFRKLLDNTNIDLTDEEKSALSLYFDETINNENDSGVYTFKDFQTMLQATQDACNTVSGK